MRWLRTLLLGTFLLGGPGLPLLDALLFHGPGASGSRSSAWMCRAARVRTLILASSPHRSRFPARYHSSSAALALSLEELPLPCTLYPSSDVHAYESLSARPRAPPLSTI